MADIKSKGKNILKRYPIILHLLLMIGISAVLVVAISIFVKIYSRQGQEYEMTNLIGKTLEESGIRSRYSCMVVGMEEGKENLSSVGPKRRFEEGDILWIVGEQEALDALMLAHQ